MASIRDLLNPLPEPRPNHFSTPRRFETPFLVIPSRVQPARAKRPKMAKDGPIFRLGNVHGVVRYPPCEDRDEELSRIHTEWKLYPMGKIADYPRQIPYSSDKKSFQEKTGRDSFHVFQYTFQIPGEVDSDGNPKEWVMIWDYNIGLVRTTHLFQCCNHPKTIPGKVLSQNPGLRDICHSITGGAIAAQGYWMPYETAKAVAATFCWKIRHVLTPLFGTDFPSLCVPPSDRSHYNRMIIDPATVRRATETAHYYRSLELQSQAHALTGGSENESTSSSHFPRRTREDEKSPAVEDRPACQTITKFPRHRYTDSGPSVRDSSSEPYCVSPQSPTGSTWTPVNAPHPRSSDIIPRSWVPSPGQFYRRAVELRRNHLSRDGSESETDLSSVSPSDAIRNRGFAAEMGGVESGSTDVDSSESFSEMSLSEEDMSVDDDEDEDYRGPRPRAALNGGSPSEKEGERLKKNRLRSVKTKDSDRTSRSGHFAHEVKAAHALLRLHMQEATNEGLENDSQVDESACRSTLGLAFRPSSLSSSRKRRRVSL